MRWLFSLLFLSSLAVCVSAIKCYLCNSLMQAECEDDYEKFQRFCPIRSFAGAPPVKPIGCRINRQFIQGEYSVVRECAYTGVDVVGKSHKGSLGVSRIMSQCSTHLCNSSNPISIISSLLLAFYVLFSL